MDKHEVGLDFDTDLRGIVGKPGLDNWDGYWNGDSGTELKDSCHLKWIEWLSQL